MSLYTPPTETCHFTALAANGWSISEQGPMPGSRLGLFFTNRACDDPSARYAPPWSASAAWRFVAALLASLGLAILIATRRCGRRSDRGVAAPSRQSDARRTHSHPRARAWNCTNLYAGR